MAKQPNGYIRQITPRDEKLFIQLAKTGMASIEQSEKYVDVKIKRLKKLERSKYIKLTTLTHSGKETTIIQLETKGKSYLKNNLNIHNFIESYKIYGLDNDISFTEKYYKCTTEFQNKFNISQLAKEIYCGNLYITEINMMRYFVQDDSKRLDILYNLNNILEKNDCITYIFISFLNKVYSYLININNKKIDIYYSEIKFKILLDIIKVIPLSRNLILLKYVLSVFDNLIYYDYFFELKSFAFNIDKYDIPFRFLLEKCIYFNTYDYLYQFLLDTGYIELLI